MKTRYNLLIVVFIISVVSSLSYAQTCLPYNSSALKVEKNTVPANILETKLNNNIVYLKWTCCVHPEDSYFLIQKSSDGYNFKTIGLKKCYGDSLKINILYCFKDKLDNNAENKVYYRIAKPLTDGNYLYSNICLVEPPINKRQIFVDYTDDL